jgi:hypothetical protein
MISVLFNEVIAFVEAFVRTVLGRTKPFCDVIVPGGRWVLMNVFTSTSLRVGTAGLEAWQFRESQCKGSVREISRFSHHNGLMADRDAQRFGISARRALFMLTER